MKIARKQTSRMWESVSKSQRSFLREEKTLEEYPAGCACEQQFADDGGTTSLYHPLASLINNKAQLQNCLDIYKTQGAL